MPTTPIKPLNRKKNYDKVLPEDKQLIQFLDALEEEAAAEKFLYDRNWEDNLKFYRGNQWGDKKRPQHKVSFILNLTYSTVERISGLLTDTRPTMNVLPLVESEDHERIAGMLTDIAEVIWDDRDFDQILTRAIMKAATLGTVGMSTVYNPNLDLGYGGVDFPIIDARDILIDPYLSNVNRLNIDGEFSITSNVKTVAELVTKYPKKGSFVKPDLDLSSFQPGGAGNFSKHTRSPTGWLSRFSRVSSAVTGTIRKSQQSIPSVIPRVWMTEYFIKDRSVNTTNSELTTDWGTVIAPGKPIFQGFRRILRAGDVILIDEECQYYDRQSPLEMFEWKFDPATAWGKSELSDIIDLNRIINKLGASFIENVLSMNNMVWIGDSDALPPEKWDELTDAPGQHIKKRPGRDLHRDAPPALPSHTVTVFTMLINALNTISGLNEASQGQRPKGVSSGVALEALQMASQVVVRLRARSIESFIERVYQKALARIFQYYTTDRLFHLARSKEDVEKFHFIRQKFLEKKGGTTLDPKVIYRDFKFNIEQGSSLGTSRLQRGIMAGQLFSLGVIDEEALLEAVEWPNKETTLKRMRKKAQLQEGGGGQQFMTQGAGAPQKIRPMRGGRPTSLPPGNPGGVPGQGGGGNGGNAPVF